MTMFEFCTVAVLVLSFIGFVNIFTDTVPRSLFIYLTALFFAGGMASGLLDVIQSTRLCVASAIDMPYVEQTERVMECGRLLNVETEKTQ